MANETEKSTVAQENTDANVETEQSTSTTETKGTQSAEEKMTGVLEGKKDEGKPETKEAAKDESKPDVVDDSWEPTLPEGVKLPEEVLKDSRELLKGLPKEQAQKLADYQVKQAAKQQEATREAWEKQVKAWEDGVKADPEFKDDFGKKQGIAEKAFKEFFSPEERDYLVKTGISSYLFKAMYKVGLKVAEPSGEVEGKTGKQPVGGDAYDRLAGNFR